VTEAEDAKRETGMVDEVVPRRITTDEGAEHCQVLRMVSVIDDDIRPIITEDHIDTASSSTDSDTGVSSLSGVTTDDVTADGVKDEEPTEVVIIDKGEGVTIIESSSRDEESVGVVVSSADLTLTITSEDSINSQCS